MSLFMILGPLEFVHGDRPAPIGSTQQRATLAYLLLQNGCHTPITQLISALWGADEPASARKIVQNAVSNLRKLLHAASAELYTEQQGYTLHVPVEHIDLSHHQRLTGQAREQAARRDWATTAARLEEAQSLWRGDALADLVEAGYSWPQLRDLRELRWRLREDLIAAEIMLGKDRDVLPRMAELLQDEPTRERLCALHMLMLYRNGRQVEALDTYRRTRSALMDQLRTAPREWLRKLEHDMLIQRPELMGPSAVTYLDAGLARAV